MVSRVRPRTARRNAAVAAATAVVAGLLFVYPTSLGRSTTSVVVAHPSPAPTAVAEPSAEPSAAPSGSLVDKPTATSSTFTGDTVDTRWGPVQVRITVAGGRIVASDAVVYPDSNGRDQQINAYAVPALNQSTIAAQSDQIDTVSGATYTSEGYKRSLQSALDAAHLG